MLYFFLRSIIHSYFGNTHYEFGKFSGSQALSHLLGLFGWQAVTGVQIVQNILSEMMKNGAA